MSRTTPTLEDRLARYRPTLDDAIAARTAPASDPRRAGTEPIELDWQPADHGRSSNRSRVLVGASAVVLIGGLAFIVATRDHPPVTPANSVAPDTAAVSDGTTAADAVIDTTAAPDATTPTDAVIDTTPATVLQGSGLTPPCPPGTDTVGTGTLYLGGPAWDQNLAAAGFIFSLPTGPTVVDVAIKAIALPVIGQECSITAAPTADAGRVIVTVDAPAVATPLRLEVDIAERDGIIGVTGITGATSFETNRVGDQVSLTVTGGMPASATSVQVRFKKGDDVWELTADPTTGAAIALTVPSGEADRFPDQPVDWVLFTAIDADQHVVDAGGRLI